MSMPSKAAGDTLIDISKLDLDELHDAHAGRKIEHPFAAGHPGNKGMQALADAL